jgi:ATP-dependent Clp protease ATP-binding subunit ClpA
MADDEQKSAEVEQKVAETKESNRVEDINPVEEAKKVLEESKRILEETKKERIRIEKATAEMLVNGKSLAGQVIKAETADEKWAREAKERYKGTGLDPT